MARGTAGELAFRAKGTSGGSAGQLTALAQVRESTLAPLLGESAAVVDDDRAEFTVVDGDDHSNLARAGVPGNVGQRLVDGGKKMRVQLSVGSRRAESWKDRAVSIHAASASATVCALLTMAARASSGSPTSRSEVASDEARQHLVVGHAEVGSGELSGQRQPRAQTRLGAFRGRVQAVEIAGDSSRGLDQLVEAFLLLRLELAGLRRSALVGRSHAPSLRCSRRPCATRCPPGGS